MSHQTLGARSFMPRRHGGRLESEQLARRPGHGAHQPSSVAQQVLECLEALEPLVTDQDFVSRVVDQIARAVLATHSAVSFKVSAEGRLVFEASGACFSPSPGAALDEKWRRARLDVGLLSATALDGVTLLDWTDPELGGLDSSCHEELGIGTSMAVFLGRAGADLGRVLMLHRTPSSRPFSDREQAMLVALRPHLDHLLRAHEAIMALAAQRLWPAELKRRCRRLSRREAEIAGLLCTRLTMPEIAARLIISPRTVETHVAHIYEKLGMSCRGELVRALRDDAAAEWDEP